LTKTINTLVEDINNFVSNPTEISEEVINAFGQRIASIIRDRIGSVQQDTKRTLRLSNLGTNCGRKLYYSINSSDLGEPLPPEAKLKFLYGDILEELLLFLAEAAGHTVEGRQDQLSVNGVVGHRDAVIDGHLVDVKSASTFSFKKFQNNGLREDDPFAYLTQLGSYLYASKDDPLVKDKDTASFLVIDKTLGHITLDTYGFEGGKELEKLADERRAMLAKEKPPERSYTDEPDGKSGNRKLGLACSYCEFKKACWPGLTVAVYSKGPTFLTRVERPPNVETYNF
jgi:hypothetical protein